METLKKRFRIGTLAKKLNLETFVVRFWEKEFDIKSKRSEGGQRYYTPRDLERFKLIKELLYNKKFTIPGAKEVLSSTQQASSACLIIQKDRLLTLRSRLSKLAELL